MIAVDIFPRDMTGKLKGGSRIVRNRREERVQKGLDSYVEITTPACSRDIIFDICGIRFLSSLCRDGDDEWDTLSPFPLSGGRQWRVQDGVKGRGRDV
jgi:hypothetical protein